MYSLRRTLVVRFSITMFVALLAIAVWAMLETRHVLWEQLDNSIAAAAELERAVVTAGEPIPTQIGPASRAEFVSALNRFVVVRTANGAALGSNTPLAGNLPYRLSEIREALEGNSVFTTAWWAGERIRSIFLPLPSTKGESRVLQVSASLGPLYEAERYVAFVMFGTVLLGTLVTWYGVSWLTQSAMTPVGEIAEQAGKIGPANGSQRITAHAEVAEFQSLIAVLNSMLDRLDHAFHAQRRMIADAGHDLRTPITAMRGEIEIALRGQRTADQYRAVLTSALEEVDRLATISDALVMLARVEAGDLAPNVAATDVVALVEDAVRRMGNRARGHRFAAKAVEPVPEARADARLIAMVLDQLLDNAARHTPSGTAVTVRVDLAPTGDPRVVVEDNGPGLAEEALPHLFERFYRGDAARTRTAGAGLGLTIASAIIEAHGGTISAEVIQPHGLRVVFTLPHADVHADLADSSRRAV